MMPTHAPNTQNTALDRRRNLSCRACWQDATTARITVHSAAPAEPAACWTTVLGRTDTAVTVKGRVSWRDEDMSVFARNLITLDTSAAKHHPTTEADEPPFVLRVDPDRITDNAVAKLRST